MIEIPEGVSNTALWALVVGFFSPVVLNLLLSSKWTPRVQAVLAFVFSAIVGTITAWLSGAFDGAGIITGTLLVFVVAISTYRGFWKQVTPALKSVTSGKPETIVVAESAPEPSEVTGDPTETSPDTEEGARHLSA